MAAAEILLKPGGDDVNRDQSEVGPGSRQSILQSRRQIET